MLKNHLQVRDNDLRDFARRVRAQAQCSAVSEARGTNHKHEPILSAYVKENPYDLKHSVTYVRWSCLTFASLT